MNSEYLHDLGPQPTVARVVVMLVRDGSVNGQTMNADGGST
jgi:hypothetical protein